MDLVLTLPRGRVWAIEVKRSVAPKLERGFYAAVADIAPEKVFVVYGGKERFPLGEKTEAIGLGELARMIQEAP